MSTQQSTTQPQSLEPRINSSLLYTRADGIQEFVHDNIRDFFLAYWFAYQINSGQLSIKDAFKDHWSYEEQVEGIRMRKMRFLKPHYKNVISPYLLSLVSSELSADILKTIGKDYFALMGVPTTEENWKVKQELPHFLYLARGDKKIEDDLANKLVRNLKSAAGGIARIFVTSNKQDQIISQMCYLAALDHYDPVLLRLIQHPDNTISLWAGRYFSVINHFDPRILQVWQSSDPSVQTTICNTLMHMDYYTPKYVDLIKSDDQFLSLGAAQVLGEVGILEQELINLVNHPKENTSIAAAYAIGRMILLHGDIRDELRIKNPDVYTKAAESLKYSEAYPNYASFLQKDPLPDSVLRFPESHQQAKKEGKLFWVNREGPLFW